tara:strand:+ start:36 stop:893 length:858 start_codon:yes stop_codon:yes gene_type:complete
MKNYTAYILFVILSTFFMLLPRRVSIAFGNFFGSFLYYFMPIRKKVVKLNLKIAYPNLTEYKLKNLILKTYQHSGIMFSEFLRQKKFNISNITIDQNTQKILSLEEGFILLTAHFGNWEIILPILNKYKQTSAIVKVQRNLGGDKYVSKLRNLNNVTLLPSRGSNRKMIKSLLNNEILLIASDQNAGQKGIEIPFFNKSTSLPKGAPYFHYKTKLPIMIGFCTLNLDNTYTFTIKSLDFESSNNIEDLFVNINTAYSKALENEINKYPNQYFWFHKKWNKDIYED